MFFNDKSIIKILNQLLIHQLKIRFYYQSDLKKQIASFDLILNKHQKIHQELLQ